MRSRCLIVLASVLAGAATASAQRQWIVYPTSYQGDGFNDVPSGDLDGRGYKWAQGFSIRRAYWDLTFENVLPVDPDTGLPTSPSANPFPVKPALYAVEQWGPTVMPAGVTAWGWLPVEVTFDGPGDGEQATQNLFIPWNGQWGTNHQWIGMEGFIAGAWKAGGPGPQAPDSGLCTASGSSANSLQMWMKRGSTLYTKWEFSFTVPPHPVTALRLTEILWDDATCGTATLGGPVDLRCVGNADPLYNLHEPFANDEQRRQATTAVDGENALAVSNYSVWVCLDPGYPYNVPLMPGLPANGLYTARLLDRNIDFKLNYDGLNTVKWRSNDTGEFATSKVVPLNGTPGQEFVPGNYANLHFLTVSSGGQGHRLAVQAFYGDGTSETGYLNLYDWNGQTGDETAVAVGVDGRRREAGGLGFRRLGPYGDSVEHGGGGDANGAFLFAHTLAVNPCKTLTQVTLSTDFPYAPTFVVESRSGGRNYTSFSTTGSWVQDTAKSTAGDTTPGIGSLLAGAGSGSTAVFSFTPSVTTYYNVQTTWGKNLDACAKAAFTVTYDNAVPVTILKNQRNDGDGWQHLGQFHLTAGNTYTVTLDAASSTEGPRVYADAVRWETNGITANVLAATFEAGSCVSCNQPWADADGDADVDMTDFAVFQTCMTMTGGAIAQGCECMDANMDNSVDLDDLADFADCSLGPQVFYVHNASPPYWPNWPANCPGMPAQ